MNMNQSIKHIDEYLAGDYDSHSYANFEGLDDVDLLDDMMTGFHGNMDYNHANPCIDHGVTENRPYDDSEFHYLDRR